MTKEEEEEEEDWARRWREPQLSDVRLLSEGCRQEGPKTETNNEKQRWEKITVQFERPSAYVQRVLSAWENGRGGGRQKASYQDEVRVAPALHQAAVPHLLLPQGHGRNHTLVELQVRTKEKHRLVNQTKAYDSHS